jgi:hypothetical protein
MPMDQAERTFDQTFAKVAHTDARDLA